MQSPAERAAVGRESSHQSALFIWAKAAENFGVKGADDPRTYSEKGYALATYGMRIAPDRLPQLRWLHAINNQGHGDEVRGNMKMAEGVKAGVFDTFLPVPMVHGIPWRQTSFFPGGYAVPYGDGNVYTGYHGLYVELKRPGKHKTSPAQLEFGQYAQEMGYAAVVRVGWLEARETLLRYLGVI